MGPRRSGRISASQSQSQSQTQSTPEPPPTAASQSDFGSYWAATPQSQPRHTGITLALLPEDIPLDAKRATRFQEAGLEAVGDTSLKDGNAERRVESGWSEKGVKRRRLNAAGEVVGEGSRKLRMGSEGEEFSAEWYTAGWSFPCSCQLPKWSHASQPRYPPPQSSNLHILPLHDDPSERPIPNHQLPEWDQFDRGSKTSMTDLDPILDDLKEFEPVWRDADGGWGREWEAQEVVPAAEAGPSGVRRDRSGAIIDQPARVEPSGVPRARSGRPLTLAANEWWKEFGEVVTASTSTVDQGEPKGRRKGKEKAAALPITAAFRLPLLPPRQDTPPVVPSPERPERTLSIPAESGIVEEVGAPGEAAADWEAESKRRKQIWRRMIESDDGYGQMWRVIKEPHQYPARFVRPTPPRTKPDSKSTSSSNRDYVLPRALQTLPHPYHPALSHYISSHPRARLYWLIPIHGPVYIPGINTHPPSPYLDPQLSPSIASLRTTQPFVEPTTRPFPLIWTPSLLVHFMSLLVGLYSNPPDGLGGISIRLSGPKPDAYIDLPAPAPLPAHAHLPSPPPSSPTPERPECGDHLRIYVEARYALALRTWLHNIDVPWSEVGDHGTKHAFEAKALGAGSASLLLRGSSGVMDTQMEGSSFVRPRKAMGLQVFNKVRLALVGEKGEVLVVA